MDVQQDMDTKVNIVLVVVDIVKLCQNKHIRIVDGYKTILETDIIKSVQFVVTKQNQQVVETQVENV